jgi:hypothetical protein
MSMKTCDSWVTDAGAERAGGRAALVGHGALQEDRHAATGNANQPIAMHETRRRMITSQR